MQLTTDLRLMNPHSERMTGSESYPITGGLVTEKEVRQIISRFNGLARQWDCFEKATITTQFIGGTVAVGSLFIWNPAHDANYGHAFNPPFEFHAWVQLTRTQIVDLALPGVIEMALLSRDAQGPLVTGRKPFILAGNPPEWCQYQPYQFVIMR